MGCRLILGVWGCMWGARAPRAPKCWGSIWEAQELVVHPWVLVGFLWGAGAPGAPLGACEASVGCIHSRGTFRHWEVIFGVQELPGHPWVFGGVHWVHGFLRHP